jgi:thioredoxin-like negative regulator of GroEL
VVRPTQKGQAVVPSTRVILFCNGRRTQEMSENDFITNKFIIVKAPLILSINNPEKEIIDSWLEKSKHQLIIVVFSSLWSGSTHILRTYLRSIIEEFPQVEKIFVDIEEQEKLALEFGVNQVPTTVLIKDGEISETIIGTISKKKLRIMVESYI